MSSPQPFAVAAATTAALRSFEAQWLARQSDSPRREPWSARDPLSALRAEAMGRFLRLGLPTTRDESWRYTNLRRLAAESFIDAPRAPAGSVGAADALDSWRIGERLATIPMVNGFPVLPAHTNAGARIDAGSNYFEINSLRELSRVNPDLVARHLAPLSDADGARWGLLNTALFTDGLYLKISGNLAAPLVIVHTAAADRPGTIAYPRVIVDAAPGSNATIIEHHVQRGEWTPLCNSATQLALGQDAAIEHYRIFATGSACTHIDSLDVLQQRGSRCKQFTIALGGGLVRASLDAHLNEPGACLDSYSLLVGHEERQVDCVNIATHHAAHTRSQQTARSIASGTSRVIFNSKVVVEAGAVQAESQQSCRGLLLSDSAEIDSRPQLEIHADEVKCAHGATTGRLDPDMLFYMLSRGLDRGTAQSLLIYAFLADALTGMSLSAARSAIEDALIAQLPDSQVLRSFR
ncbi:MAG TPA: Fe-S cluster assembly protein SufD [Steroidobacteraceae bacterium]|nr:Fe-S cluster assembly protein SufD [Steroidobacteraceae bacterium]